MFFKFMGNRGWPTTQFLEDVKKLSELKDDQIERLAKWFNDTYKVVGLSNKDVITTCITIDVDPNIFSDIIHAARFVVFHWHKSGITLDELKGDLGLMVAEDEKLNRLVKFFSSLESNKEKIFKQIEINNYSRYGIPYITDITFLCDLRAVFVEYPHVSYLYDSNNADKLIDVLPVIIMNVGTYDEADSGRVTCFQMGEERLVDLQKSINVVLAQIEQLKKRYINENISRG